ncbi:MAG: nucleotidyl transferase AbiEii/AbiGii toxin family protein [Candidatus Aenigmarchaeota archaeon]|nr:nucleotidyl transferase AbiEii/AbiGii toxin family protein [Candidatus Aenigmarchaeota archaeon]
MKDSIYYRQAKLLLRILPIIGHYPVFALKGGTAINFFIRDMPRLSVDIDLTYVQVDERETALASIHSTLNDISSDIKRLIPDAVVMPRNSGKIISGLSVRADGCSVKIEPNLILRGTVYEPVVMTVKSHVQKMFELTVDSKVLSLADIYGGKICAALDRQHPRDLFDIKLLLDNEGITDDIRKSFIVHLISHDRPMAELLRPHYQDIKKVFENEFDGMTFVKVSMRELEEARDVLVQKIHKGLTDKEKNFIISVKKGMPEWDLLGLRGVDLLPAVQWKLLNISRMGKAKQNTALKKLEKALSPEA